MIAVPGGMLNAGTKLASYEISGALGVGGMGEVEPNWRRVSRQAKSRAFRERDLLC